MIVWGEIKLIFLNTIYLKKIGQNSDIDKNQLGVKCDPSTSNHNKTETTSYLFIAGTLIFFCLAYSVPDEWATTKCGIVRKFCSNYWNEIIFFLNSRLSGSF